MNRDLILVALSMFIWGAGEGMFFYYQPLYLQQLGADPLEIGAILSGYGIAMAAVHIPAGYLSDRMGRRPMMWAAWLMGLAATVVMASAGNLSIFVAGMVLYAITTFVSAPLSSYATTARGQWSVGQALLLISTAYNLGAVLGPALGGLIGGHYGLRTTFWGAAGVFVLSVSVILFIRPQPVDRHMGQSGVAGRFKLQPRHMVYLAAVFIAVFTTYLPQPFAQNFLHNERGLGLETIGLLLSLTGLGVALLNSLLSLLPPRFAYLLAQAAVGGFAVCLWLGTGLPIYIIGYFLLGGYKTSRSLATAQTRSLVEASQMGLAYGITESTSAAAIILAPLLAGYLYMRSPELVFMVACGLIVVSLVVSAAFCPAPGKSSANTHRPNAPAL